MTADIVEANEAATVDIVYELRRLVDQFQPPQPPAPRQGAHTMPHPLFIFIVVCLVGAAAALSFDLTNRG
jgi:hypothetical protein